MKLVSLHAQRPAELVVTRRRYKAAPVGFGVIGLAPFLTEFGSAVPGDDRFKLPEESFFDRHLTV
jgi:hypothetical protein